MLVVSSAVVLILLWWFLARLVATEADRRGQDGGYWFRLALINPLIVGFLLVFTTRPPNDRYR